MTSKRKLVSIIHTETPEIWYELAYTYYPGSPETRISPEEEGEIDITAFYAVQRGGAKVDITTLLDEWDIRDRITMWLWNTYDPEVDEPPEESYERQAREEGDFL